MVRTQNYSLSNDNLFLSKIQLNSRHCFEVIALVGLRRGEETKHNLRFTPRCIWAVSSPGFRVNRGELCPQIVAFPTLPSIFALSSELHIVILQRNICSNVHQKEPLRWRCGFFFFPTLTSRQPRTSRLHCDALKESRLLFNSYAKLCQCQTSKRWHGGKKENKSLYCSNSAESLFTLSCLCRSLTAIDFFFFFLSEGEGLEFLGRIHPWRAWKKNTFGGKRRE